MDLKEIDILGDSASQHWYYQSKAAAIIRLLADTPIHTVLDVGAGSGYFSRHLLSRSLAEKAVCVDTSYTADSESREGDKPILFRRAAGSIDADLVMLLDVLEHVDDDAGLLKHYMGKVPVGARFLISVPAFQCLWSEHDEFLEHRRRYTLGQLEKLAEKAGLAVLEGCYYFATVLPVATGIRLRGKILQPRIREPQSQLRSHSSIVNNLLKIVCRAELPLMRHNRIAGLTAFCVAEYRAEESHTSGHG